MTSPPVRSSGALGLAVLAVVVGIVAGLGAVVFRAMIALFPQPVFPRPAVHRL